MAKEKVFRFRIKEETEHYLDEGVVKDFAPRYKLYKKIPFIFGGWKHIPCWQGDAFYSVDDARKQAEVYVVLWKKDKLKKQLKKKHKKELKTTVKIVFDFDIPA